MSENMRLIFFVGITVLLIQCKRQEAGEDSILLSSSDTASYHASLEYQPRSPGDEMDSLVALLNSYYLFQGKIIPPVIEENEDYRLQISDQKVSLEKQHFILKNPFSKVKYPMSYSILYKGKLIVLFDPGRFACFDLDLKRDPEIEDALNTMHFDRHWLIGEDFVARSEGKYYVWNGKSWASYNEPVPMGSRPKLFEDEFYIMYSDCHGEFGGTIYFYEKKTGITYYTAATCPRAVLPHQDGYLITASSMTSFNSIFISNPSKLSNLKDTTTIARRKGAHENLGYYDSSNHAVYVKDFFWLEAFGTFKNGEKTFYILNWREFAFLAKLNGNEVTIVNPLFLDHQIYTHKPVTTVYPNGVIVVNLDFYGLGGEREVSLLIFKKNHLIKVDWNELHRPWVESFFRVRQP
jgi:hypothetical protein